MLIDAGETMVATPGACIEDVKMSYIRVMNHLPKDKKEDVEEKKDEMTATVTLVFGETARPRWYLPTALHLEYTQWYCCRVVTVNPIFPGDELTFPYDWTPKHWAKATPSRTRVAGRGSTGGSETTGACVACWGVMLNKKSCNFESCNKQPKESRPKTIVCQIV